ncbi:MAG: hypothetical protein M1815_001173 [Lichina confinis]|nr:MAG: hypothetical protein M1815_001173 [Lichina confinis]
MAGKIIKELRRLGFRAQICRGGEDPDFTKWVVAHDSSLHLKRRDMDTHDRDTHFLAIELKSPIMEANETTLLEVAAVANAIRRKFRVLHNRSCGVHVHVGNSTRGFPMHVLRNAAMLASAFELPLSTIHPPHRQWSAFCKQLNSQPLLGADRQERLATLAGIPTISRLVDLTNQGGRYWSVNFRNCLSRHATRTVEFRQHKATFSRKKLVFWIQFVVGLMRYAAMLETDDVQTMAEDHDEEEENPRMMFEEMNLTKLRDHTLPSYPVTWEPPMATARDRLAGEWSFGPGYCSGETLYKMYMQNEEDLEVTFPTAWQRLEDMDLDEEVTADMNFDTDADSWDIASESSNEADDDV